MKKILSRLFTSRKSSVNMIDDTIYSEYIQGQIGRSKAKSTVPSLSTEKRKCNTVGLLKTLVPFENIAKALVVGCRDEKEIQLLSEEGVADVIGVDLFSNSPIIRVGDMHNLPFRDNEFDFLYSSHSLEHALYYGRALSEFIRVLSKNGLLFIEVPVHYSITEHDLHDFESTKNLLQLVESFVHIKDVILAKNIKLGDLGRGTDAAQILIRINKIY